jgi:hypothetical protein
MSLQREGEKVEGEELRDTNRSNSGIFDELVCSVKRPRRQRKERKKSVDDIRRTTDRDHHHLNDRQYGPIVKWPPTSHRFSLLFRAFV